MHILGEITQLKSEHPGHCGKEFFSSNCKGTLIDNFLLNDNVKRLAYSAKSTENYLLNLQLPSSDRVRDQLVNIVEHLAA